MTNYADHDHRQFASAFLAAAYGPDTEYPPTWVYVLNVVGEAGEFAEAYRRYSGYARRKGNISETAEELADVVIAAYVAAQSLNINLDDHIAAKRHRIMNRGFTE